MIAVLYMVVQKTSARVLIIVPTNVLQNWMDEIAKWLELFADCKADRTNDGECHLVWPLCSLYC